MKHQDIKQIDGVIAGLSTRKEKLERWADLVRFRDEALAPLYAVENRPAKSLRTHGKHDRFWAGTIAFNDPLFRVMGLKSASAWDVVEFFDADAPRTA